MMGHAHLGLLLALTVSLWSQIFPREADQLFGVRSGIQTMDTNISINRTQLTITECSVCGRIVGGLIRLTEGRFRRKSAALCRLFRPDLRVIIQSEFLPQLSIHTRTGNLNQNFFSKNPEGKTDHMEDIKKTSARCNFCEKVVAGIEGTVEDNIQKYTGPFCLSLKQKYRAMCLQKTKVYEHKVLDVVFTGGPTGTCRRMGHCS